MPALPPFRDEADPIWERRVKEFEEPKEPKGKAGGILGGEFPNPTAAFTTEYIDISEGEINKFYNLTGIMLTQSIPATLLTNTEKILNYEGFNFNTGGAKTFWRIKGQFAGTTKILGIKPNEENKPNAKTGKSSPLIALYNVGAEKVAFVNESAEVGVEAANKLILKEAEVVLSTNGFIKLWYDRESTKWREW